MRKAGRLLLSREAYEDFELITEPLRTAILDRLKLLRKFPLMGAPLVGNLKGIRATTVEIFRIFYRVTDRGVEILYIRHCKRRLPEMTP